MTLSFLVYLLFITHRNSQAFFNAIMQMARIGNYSYLIIHKNIRYVNKKYFCIHELLTDSITFFHKISVLKSDIHLVKNRKNNFVCKLDKDEIQILLPLHVLCDTWVIFLIFYLANVYMQMETCIKVYLNPKLFLANVASWNICIGYVFQSMFQYLQRQVRKVKMVLIIQLPLLSEWYNDAHEKV